MAPNRRKRKRDDRFASEVPSSPASAKRRHVYLVARPIHALSGPFEFLSHGKFPLCHWGFVLSQFNQDQLKEHFDHQVEDPSSPIVPLGTLFELKRDPHGQMAWQLNMDDKFGPALASEWSRMCIGYIGETRSTDNEIISFAQLLIESHPIYHGLTNNCQNFVAYCVQHICPESTASLLPSTIQQALFYLSRLDRSSFDGRPFQVIFVSSTWQNIRLEDENGYAVSRGLSLSQRIRVKHGVGYAGFRLRWVITCFFFF